MTILCPPALSREPGAAMTPCHGARNSSAEVLADCVRRGGCEACFSELVRRLQAPLLHYLIRRVNLRPDAEDLVQETFLVAYRKIGRYRSSWRFSTWVFTIAHRLAASSNRRKRNATSWANEIAPRGGDADPSSIAQEDEMRSKLWDAARDILEPDAFTAVWLSYVEAMPADQIGVVLGRNANAVRILLHRARVRLAEELKYDWK